RAQQDAMERPIDGASAARGEHNKGRSQRAASATQGERSALPALPGRLRCRRRQHDFGHLAGLQLQAGSQEVAQVRVGRLRLLEDLGDLAAQQIRFRVAVDEPAGFDRQ
ncbi:MAG: hypothetical protein AB7R90_22180, partial [Reyranellaceae bacterium]